jgi:hypothetical protein
MRGMPNREIGSNTYPTKFWVIYLKHPLPALAAISAQSSGKRRP